MAYDVDDTIAADASAPGGGARGVVRISGADVVARLTNCFTPAAGENTVEAIRTPRRIRGFIRVCDSGRGPLEIPGDLLLWPSTRSYTREASAEFHTIGSPPLLAAVVEELSRNGVRPAEPGEFTLRAFLAGRIDLTQAEAVLGVIDACERTELDAALDQLAGGLSRPLHRLREQLLGVLAELEAGLDFVDEDIEFISRASLRAKLMASQNTVATALEQHSSRDVRAEVPRIAITGPPNAGKSRLFNALVERYGAGIAPDSIVSSKPGATRDYVAARLNLGSIACDLIDTAGIDSAPEGSIQGVAQALTAEQQRSADVQLQCVDASTTTDVELVAPGRSLLPSTLLAATKSDLVTADLRRTFRQSFPGAVPCSAVTGEGLVELAGLLRGQIAEAGAHRGAGIAAATSARCQSSLREASRALCAALELSDGGDDELTAAEIRAALDSLGEVVGATCSDDVLDRVFRQFCIGK
jgi:tRNA modification GTPase